MGVTSLPLSQTSQVQRSGPREPKESMLFSTTSSHRDILPRATTDTKGLGAFSGDLGQGLYALLAGVGEKLGKGRSGQAPKDVPGAASHTHLTTAGNGGKGDDLLSKLGAGLEKLLTGVGTQISSKAH